MLYHLNLLEMEKAQHFAEEALRVAERLDDAARLVGGHMALGVVLYWQGKLEPALAHFRRGFGMFDPNMQFPDWPGAHPGVQCQFYPALISWMLGYPDRSIDELTAAVRSAETLGHPLTLAQTLTQGAALIHIFRQEPPAAADCAGRALKICEEHRIAHFHALAVCENGWALGVSGEREKGLAQIGQGLDSYGLGTFQHWLLALQSDAQLAIGKPDHGLGRLLQCHQIVLDPLQPAVPNAVFDDCPRFAGEFDAEGGGDAFERVGQPSAAAPVSSCASWRGERPAPTA